MPIYRIPISGGSAQIELPAGFEYHSGRVYTLEKNGETLKALEARWMTPTGSKTSLHVFDPKEPVEKYLQIAARDVQYHVARGHQDNGGSGLTRNQRRLLFKGM